MFGLNETKVSYKNELIDYDTALWIMDDDIREELHFDFAGMVTEQEFFDLYCERHEKKYGKEFLCDDNGHICY